MTEAKRKGRPKAAKGRHYATAVVILSRCPKCGSTERSAYTKTTEVEAIGEENGLPFDTVVWRTCKCLKCGQWRRDRSTEVREGTK